MSRSLHPMFAAAGILVAACVPSLHPVYTSGDVLFEPALLGAWTASDSDDYAVITQGKANSYVIAYTDDEGKTGRFVGHLLRVQGRLVLDLVPDEPPLDASELYKDLLLPLHIFLFLDTIGPQVSIATLEPDSVERHLRAQPSALAHAVLDDGIILTAPPTELQAFLASYGTLPGVMSEPEVWVRPHTKLFEQAPSNQPGA